MRLFLTVDQLRDFQFQMHNLFIFQKKIAKMCFNQQVCKVNGFLTLIMICIHGKVLYVKYNVNQVL